MAGDIDGAGREALNGGLEYLVVGNLGYLQDARQTPFVITRMRHDIGMFDLKLLDFEQQGANWRFPYEDVERLSFKASASRATHRELDQIEAAVDRLDHPYQVECTSQARHDTMLKLAKVRQIVTRWIEKESSLFATTRALLQLETLDNLPVLQQIVGKFMQLLSVSEIEEAFVSQFVNNPDSGECVKAHRIAIAKMGLVPYRGKVIRDPKVWQPPFDQKLRQRHIIARMALVQEVFARLGYSSLTLYRGMCSDGLVDTRAHSTFVSTSFNQRVATGLFEARGQLSSGFLCRQLVPIERVFMTYLETARLNRYKLAAEVVLLADEANSVF